VTETTETTAPRTPTQISARFREIAPYPDKDSPEQAKALAGWLTGQAQRRWTRCLDLIPQEGPLYMTTISAMLSDFAALHLLMAMAEIDTGTADRLAVQIRETWDDGGEVGPLIWQHAVALGIDPAEISRLEEACHALEVPAKAASDPVARLRLIADQDIGGNAPWLADELHAFADRLAAEMRGESQAPSISITYDLPPISPGRLPAPPLGEKWLQADGGRKERTEEGQ
jgi:hypothetical protein